MNAIVETKPASLLMPRDQLIEVLGRSLYPGARADSIGLVIDYCTALQLDPMQKPVHIVPMKVSTGVQDQYGNDKKEWRDVIMAGIGLYRIQAARTGAYLGVSEPTFGPDLEFDYEEEFWEDKKKKRRSASVTFPSWCKVTVRRQVGGVVAEFTAMEYWKENYATKGEFAPNSMWAKRPYGQLAKCAEAQALRKAFPEVGTEPTMEEMEGKLVDVNEMQMVEGNPPGAAAEPSLTPQRKSAAAAATDAELRVQPTAQPDAQQDSPAAAAAAQPAAQPDARVIDGEFKEVADKPAAPAAAGPALTEGMRNTLLKKMENAGKTEAQFLAKFGTPVAEAPRAQVNDYLAWTAA